jgi:zinc/manganese transport system permease protein
MMTAVTTMVGHPFMRHALVAGTAIAVATGLVGYFAVLRSQVFTGDALSHAAFTGALAALAAGVDQRLGLLAATVGVALLLGLLGPRGRADDVVIGSVFAWVLGLGVLFLSLYTSHRSAGNGAAGVSVLFGSIFGLSAGAVRLAVVLGAAISLAVVVLARPLLFASLDEAVAAAQGVPVRTLSLTFLVLIGLTAAQATQAVGALLLLGLLSAPAAAAQQLTSRPFAGLALSAVLAAAALWVGLTLSYAVPRLPPSFSVIAVAAAIYASAGVTSRLRRRTSRLGARRPTGAGGADVPGASVRP